ncbi:hypothetical protein EGW08_009209 [Elysia chlorotica]|uniref:Major facilitator superfamily (MFS) profile domain-containing protein n=1 Tax=Elysia chlorotica TaxID=188477 RepID=A0A433TNC3_ELYCH|nr:hypothetical protein EGW08_009209 [Elysia chlorotica]
MIFASPLEHRFGIQACLLGGDILLSLSFISVYFIIDEPLALALIFGGLHGASVGIVYALTVKLLLQTMTTRGGLATGIMSAGFTIGTGLFIGAAFAVINPMNKKPDLKVENKVYFSDKDLLNRVPIFFLLMGFMTIATNCVGAAFMYIGSRNVLPKDKIKTSVDNGEQIPSQLSSHDAAGQIFTPDEMQEEVPLIVSAAQSYDNYGHKSEICASSLSLNGSSNTEETPKNGHPQDIVHRDTRLNSELSSRDVLKTARFWLVWIAFVTSNHTFFIYLTLYKEYGEQKISDDSMLVTTGIISSIGTIIVCPLVGMASDRIGIRCTNVIFNGGSCLFMALMVIALHTCPWVYMVLVVVESMGVSPHTMLFSLLAANEFGKTNVASNMGLIRSGNIPLVLLEPIIVDVLIRTIGWDWVFLTGSLASAVATVAIVALDYF